MRRSSPPLAWGHLAGAQTLVLEAAVVLKGTGHHLAVDRHRPLRRQVGAHDGRVQDRGARLRRRQRAHHGQTRTLLLLEDREAGVPPCSRPARLGTEEGGRHHHLIAQYETVQVEVMAIELPSPRFVVGWRAEDAQEVRPFAVLVDAAGDLGEDLVEPHDVADVVESPSTEARSQQFERRLPLGRREVFE